MVTLEQWIDRHARAFGMSKTSDFDMLNEWAEVFRQRGFTPDELNEATTNLMGNDEVKYRTDQMNWIQKYLTNLRTNKPAPEPDGAHGTCTLCDSSGIVIVPHPRYMIGLEWISPQPTAAVTCSCGIGRWKAERINSYVDPVTKKLRAPMMGLEKYNAEFPGWRNLMADKAKADAAANAAHGTAAAQDRAHGQLRFKNAVDEVVRKAS